MDPLAFSARASFDLSENPLAVALATARQARRPVLDLTVSNPTTVDLPYEREAILSALASPGALVYEPAPFGLPSARAAVGAHLGVDPDRVVLTASTSEAYSFVFKLLCDPGDEVLVPAPSYPLFEHLARLESVRVMPYRVAYDGAWHVDADAVRSARTARTRAIVLVSPNNPTGSYVKETELAALAALDLPLVSDEVFAGYPLREVPGRAATALASDARLVFALGGLSKSAALPQMKLAWTAVGGEAPAVRAALARLEVVADAFLSVGAPVQHALPALLATRARVEGAISARCRANLAVVQRMVEATPVTALDVEAGWYVTLRVPRTMPELDWALALLRDDDVYVHPGHFFDFEGEAYLVVSLLTPEATLREGMRRLVSRVARDA